MNVICELARKNPKNYLSLAPVFFKLMTNSTNNWMLIKIIKLVSRVPCLSMCWRVNIVSVTSVCVCVFGYCVTKLTLQQLLLAARLF